MRPILRGKGPGQVSVSLLDKVGVPTEKLVDKDPAYPAAVEALKADCIIPRRVTRLRLILGLLLPRFSSQVVIRGDHGAGTAITI